MKKNMLKLFEKDLEIYEKYYDTVKCITALIEYDNSLEQKSHKSKIIFDYFMERIIKNLGDAHIEIYYKGKISSLYNKLYDMRDELYKKYEGYITDEMLSKITFYNQSNSSYNLVSYTSKYCETCEWEREMLFSRMPVEERANIFIESVNNASGYQINRAKNLLSKKNYPRLIVDEIKTSSIVDLISYMWTNDDFKKEALKELKIDTIQGLQEDGILDFTYCGIISDILSKNGGEYNYKIYDLIATIFNSDSYATVETEVARSMDIIDMIHKSLGYDMSTKIYRIMKLNFDIDQYIIEALTEQIVKEWDRIDNPNQVRMLVFQSILKKAKTKKEYQKLLVLSKEFLRKTDVDKKRRAIYKEKELQKGIRKELTNLFYNLNDKLQEQVPGKRLLKEVNFKKLS